MGLSIIGFGPVAGDSDFAASRKSTFMHIAVLGDFNLSEVGAKQYLQPVITQYFASNKSEIWS